MTLKVIGTGFGRTGTDSMREALEILGFGPCHHMFEVDTPEKVLDWRRAILGAPRDWDVLLGGYAACVDWPSAFFWPELVEAFPDAKVLLTYRSAESWWASYEKTILQHIRHTDPDDDSRLGFVMANQIFDGRIDDRATCIAAYEANVACVMARVPAERLLVYTLGQGWDPLCAFLGAPVPEVPYPNRNATDDFQKKAAESQKMSRGRD
jgi:hypothetical protein